MSGADRGARTMPPNGSLPSAVIVGGGSLTIECAARLRRRGLDLVAIVTDTADVAAWGHAEGVPVIPLGDASGHAWDIGGFDYLLSIVNLRVLGDAELRLPRRAAINFHDGPLPRYGGLNVTSWAILAGEREHAVTWHLMRGDVDAGDVVVTRTVPIAPFDTAHTLNTACFEAGLESFGDLLERLVSGDLAAKPQSEGERGWFTRATRPPLGGALDLRADARALGALARSLDFGPYANTLGLPTLVVDGRSVVIERVRPRDGTKADAAPGTFLGVDDSGMHIRAGDGDVTLVGPSTVVGEVLAPTAAARYLGLEVGDVVPPPSDAAVDGFARAMRRWARFEDAWVDRLAALDALPAPLVGAGAGLPSTRPSIRQVLPDALRPSGERPGDTLLAAVAAFLGRLAPAAGGDVAFRHGALRDVPGDARERFVPFVPLRIERPSGVSFAAYLDSALVHFDDTIRRGGYTRDLPRRRPSLSTLDAAWVRERWSVTLERVADLEAVSDDTAPGAGLSVTIPDDGSAMLWRHDPGRVSVGGLERLMARFTTFLGALEGGATVEAASVLAPDDLVEMRAWNDTRRDADAPSTVHAAIEVQVRRTPQRRAVVAGSEELSYHVLDQRAERLARALQRRGVRPGDRVGVMVDRDAGLVVSLLAILKAGAAYVPLDPAFPADRVKFMVEDADLALVVARRQYADAAGIAPERVLDVGSIADELSLAHEHDDAHVVVEPATTRSDLVYVIYTSGSTGRPKGVMLEHGNVLNFMVGMDDVLRPTDDPGTWLAVTSVSFDISVLELLWTLARGFTVVVYAGDDRKPASGGPRNDRRAGDQPMELSLFYFASDAADESGNRYRLLLDGARFADAHGFSAVWTPERHFHAFGGLYPNPAVAGAAIAALTQRVRIRAGSCVLPLHHRIRVAEEWAVVDNLSEGRVDVSFASGWQPDDFVLAPDHLATRNEIMYRDIETVRALWRGEPRTFDGPDGRRVTVSTLPRPVQAELPVWVTAAGNPATFTTAGAIGAHVLTHMLGQDMAQLTEKISMYREAWAASGRPGRGHVSLMLHTFVGTDSDAVRAIVRAPLRSYLESSAGLMRQYASSFPAFRGTDTSDKDALDATFRALGDDDLDSLLEHAFERYYETSGLFGTVAEAVDMVARVRDADVDEIACLIDFGIPTDTVLDGLRHLAELLRTLAARSDAASIPDLIDRHGVTHLQCTPSMAQMLLAEPGGRGALASLQRMLVGGEALPRELARTLSGLVPGGVVNMYGPTETTVWSTVHHVDETTVAAGGPTVSIGTPIVQTQVYVCDEAMQPLPAGVPGELVIGGHGVARGYWRRRDVTAERFVPDRLRTIVGIGTDAHSDADDRVYRTGDLARWREHGILEYLGRLDFQVKVRGHRIELGEIEVVLDGHPSVRQSVVVARTRDTGDVRLVAYVVPSAEPHPSAADLRSHAAGHLPDVMVPTTYVIVDAFPLTPNRKVDRRALPDPPTEDRSDAHTHVAPSNPVEATLAEVWQSVLSIERVGVNDNFFALGGNSLLAVFAVSQVASRGYRMTLAQLLSAPTIAALAPLLTVAPVGASDETPERDVAGWLPT